MSQQAFVARGVRARFGRKDVLAGLDLVIPAGEVAVLLGRNGAGKTTLLRAALGIAPIDEGSIEVAGFDAQHEGLALRRVVGFVPDRPDVYPWMTADDLFRFLAPHYPTWDRHEVDRLAERFELPRQVPFRALSRGQSTKALLAAALAPLPRVLILDEPFGGLDPIARDEVVRGVIGELRDGSRTVICATHEIDIAARLADRVAILAQGRIARCGSIDEITTDEHDAPAAPAAALRQVFETATAGGIP